MKMLPVMDIGRMAAVITCSFIAFFVAGFFNWAADRCGDPDEAYKGLAAAVVSVVAIVEVVMILCLSTGRPDVFGVRFC